MLPLSFVTELGLDLESTGSVTPEYRCTEITLCFEYLDDVAFNELVYAGNLSG